MNRPKVHNNETVQAFLADLMHLDVAEMCEEFPQLDDILSGVLELKTEGNTSTRSLSRQVLFHILQHCVVVDVESVDEVTHRKYAYPTLTRYAALARVASKALGRLIDGLSGATTRRTETMRQEQLALDAPFMAELSALGLV